MIVSEIDKRYSIEEIFLHPWIKETYLKEEDRLSHIKETEKERQKIQAIEIFLEDLFFPKEYIQ